MNILEILSGENKNVEYKEKRPQDSVKYLKTIIAFENGNGGYLVFGIDDKTLKISGIPKEEIFKELDAITNAIYDAIEPIIMPNIYIKTIQDKNLIIVEVSEGNRKPYYLKNEGIDKGVYIRVGGTTRKANRSIISELYYSCEGRSYDMSLDKARELSEDEINEFCDVVYNKAKENVKNKEELKKINKNILISWGVICQVNGKIYPTKAYIYLKGEDSLFSKIQCAVFKGTTRSIFIDRREYTGYLWEQIEHAYQFVLRNIRLGADIVGIYRKDVYELPIKSIRELIINATMNCSFLQNSCIQVAIFDDRLEITSPGGLMPNVTFEKMKQGFSVIRNKAIANVFYYMNLIEAFGTGIPRLFQEMMEYNLKEPEFIDLEMAIRINLYRKEIYPNVPNCSESVPKYMSSHDMILELIDKKGLIISSDVEKLLKVSQRRARAILKQMLDEKKIIKLGSTKSARYTK